MSQIKVNSIIPVSGVPTGGGGGIIQVKQTVKTDITTGTFSGTNYVDVCTVDITPTSSSSKILVSCSISVDTSGNHNATVGQFFRDSTAICKADASSSMSRGSFALESSPVSFKLPLYSMQFLDSPSTSSAVTYKISIQDGNGDGANYFINRGASSPDGANNALGVSMITVMEVSA